MLNTLQVSEQKNRFEAFIQTANLSKIGKYYLTMNGAEDGRYTKYVYLRRVLSMVANVGSSYICPGTTDFYGEILEKRAVKAYINSL